MDNSSQRNHPGLRRVRQRRINSAGARGVRLAISGRSSRSSMTARIVPSPTAAIAIVDLKHGGKPPSSSFPAPSCPPNTPLPTTPGSAMFKRQAPVVPPIRRNKSISLNSRIQKILHEKHIPSIIAGACSTSDSSDPPSSTSLVETPLQLYHLQPTRQRKDSHTAPLKTWAPLRRAKNARQRRAIPKSSPVMRAPVVATGEVWQRSRYLPGRIRVQTSLERCMMPTMTAMDVLCQEDVATDEQVMDEIADFFESYGFAPIATDLDRFWLKNSGPSRKASEAPNLESLIGARPSLQTNVLMPQTLAVGNHSRPPLRSNASSLLHSPGRSDPYKWDSVSLRSTPSIPSPSKTTYFDGRRVSGTPSGGPRDVLVFGPQSSGSTHSNLKVAAVSASPPTSLSPHWHAHSVRSTSPSSPSSFHRRSPGMKTPSPKAQSPKHPGKLSFRKLLANRGTIV